MKNNNVLSDDDLAFSMFCFIEQYGERMIKATADACRMVADKSQKESDGTSENLWNDAANKIDSAYKILEEN